MWLRGGLTKVESKEVGGAPPSEGLGCGDLSLNFGFWDGWERVKVSNSMGDVSTSSLTPGRAVVFRQRFSAFIKDGNKHDQNLLPHLSAS